MNSVRVFGWLSVLTMALPAVAQPPSVSWQYQWDFNTSAQGWVVNGGSGRWVNPAVDPAGPVLPDGSPSGAGGGNLYLPDQNYATFELRQLGIQSVDRFAIQAEIYIPNLRPTGMCTRPPTCKLGHDGNNPDPNYGQCFCDNCNLTYHDCAYPGNMNDRAGIQMVSGNGKSLAVIGDIGNATQRLFDSNDGSNYILGGLWIMEQYLDACHTAVYPYNDFPMNACWWDKWVTLYVDCGYTIPGRIRSYIYIPWNGGRVSVGWQRLFTSDDNGRVDPAGSRSFRSIRLGQPAGLNNEFSWTQVQFDNIKLALGPNIPIPEVCSNGIDDNLDGFTDCDDPQCVSNTTACPCPRPWADWDRDGDVDQADFGRFQACFRPVGTGIPDTVCDCFDRPNPTIKDGKIDQSDFAKFLDCFTGPDVPADPLCGK